jgi:hypothetical protein
MARATYKQLKENDVQWIANNFFNVRKYFLGLFHHCKSPIFLGVPVRLLQIRKSQHIKGPQIENPQIATFAEGRLI